MKVTSKMAKLATLKSSCLVLPVLKGKKLTRSGQSLGKLVAQQMKRCPLDLDFGEILLLNHVPDVSAERVLLIGCGKDLSFGKFQGLITKLTNYLNAQGIKDAALGDFYDLVKGETPHWHQAQITEQACHASYSFQQCKGRDKKTNKFQQMHLVVGTQGAKTKADLAIKKATALSKGVTFTRDLGNLPPNICHPSYLAQQAKKLARDYTKIKTTVLNEKQMKTMGMGSLLSVAQGSKQPPRFITMEYRGAAASEAPIALVGKGVTFDSGGLSLKPAAAMVHMKYDMCGAATVFGVIKAIAEMKLKINVVGIVPSVENMPDGNSFRPDDIVKSLSGLTIEIGNTDAEGRLILCDALTYSERFKPKAVVDIATLTGACVVALGTHTSGLFGNHQPLIDALNSAGQQTYDRAWPMPLFDEYQDDLKCAHADIQNIGSRWGGAITAACFLSRFTKKLKWAHLDVAGTAFKEGPQKSATGRPVPLLVHYLTTQAGK